MLQHFYSAIDAIEPALASIHHLFHMLLSKLPLLSPNSIDCHRSAWATNTENRTENTDNWTESTETNFFCALFGS
jgi:hypothetical protein